MITIITTGGTFDKLYFDALSEFKIGEPVVNDLLQEANVNFEYQIMSVLRKDSLDMDNRDRQLIRDACERVACNKILIIHGTDTLVETAAILDDIEHKTIVLFGSMQPAGMRYSDAMYNLGFATAAVQLLPAGVHLAMNGQIFDPRKVQKNRALNRFESPA